MIFNRVRFDRPGVVNLPRGSFLASRETIVQSRPSQSLSGRPPSEDYINSAGRVPQVANWALASVCFFPDVLDRTTGMMNAWNATCDHEKTIFSSHLPGRISMGPRTPRAAARGEGRHRKSTEGGAHGREQLACARWYIENSVGSTWMAQMVGQRSVAILRRPRFFPFSFSVPTRLDSSSSINLHVISHGESNGRGSAFGQQQTYCEVYASNRCVYVNKTS